MNIGDVDFNGLFPLIALLVSICGLILFRSLSRSNFDLHRKIGAITTIGISGIIAIFEIGRWRKFDRGLIEKKDTVTLNGFVSTDRLSTISVLILSLVLIIVTLSAVTYLKNRIDIPASEFFILLQLVTLGMFAFVMANDLIAIFIALETFSLPLYALTAIDARRLRSLEGGFKYFILGAVSSAIFLYGIAIHYGVTGTTALVPALDASTLANVSMIMIIVGLLFKVAAFPFHFWSPDAYQGAPSPVTAFMSSATKLAAFVVFVRLVTSGVIDVSLSGTTGRTALTVACITSAVYGTTVALRQFNLKRAIAYSSMSHTGYILLALKTGGTSATTSVLTYVIAYAFIVTGTFLIIGFLSTPNEQNDSVISLKGLARKNPYVAGSLTILLFAQAGMPLTSGFIAKFDVFRVALQSGFYISSLIVLIATVIGAAFYLKLILSIYSNSFGEVAEEESQPSRQRLDHVEDVHSQGIELDSTSALAIGFCVVVTIAIGIFPALLTGFTHAL